MIVPLSDGDRRCLLALARASIAQRLGNEAELDRMLARTDPGPALCESRGAFVTLKQAPEKSGQAYRLRGCIGCVTTKDPLYRSVIDLGPKAAFEDPRFPKLLAGELSKTRIEISALTPMRPIDGAEQIVLGRDGVELARDGVRSVFLPRVATDQGWTVDDLLRHLARKAGLADDGWRGADLCTFQADAFADPSQL